jgi:HD-GYP domain-containing protein (c-di-GMP phosphodiesterase class II)
MAERIVIKPLQDLVPGDILQENIGTFKDLQSGVVLDKTRILQMKSLGVRQASVLDLDSEEKQRRERSAAHAREITDRIDSIFSQEKGVLKKVEDIPQPLIVDHYEMDDRKEAGQIIEHVRQSQTDILVIEGGESVSIRSINQEIDKRIRSLEKFLKSVLIEKKVELPELEDIVNQFILLTGPKRESSLLLLGILRHGTNLIIKHAVNTCLICLAVAIELSKVMDAQLRRPEVISDFKKLKICNSKIFSREELVKLGVAAILHDIGLVDVFPNITEDMIITAKEMSKIQLHPSRAFSFLAMNNLDFDIRKAILQHHERVDGSGYPDGIEKRLFTKYSLVLSFANYYELKTSKNPFERKMHPQKALLDIIQKERAAFDDDVIFAFCKTASLYPVGCWVTLSDDTIGLVIKSNRHDLKRPVVKVVYTPDLKEQQIIRFVDLSQTDLTVREVIDVESIEIFDPRYERFIFDEREFERLPYSAPCEIGIPDRDIRIKALLENISAGGLQFQCTQNFPKGQRLSAWFEFKGRPFVEQHGLICWKKDLGAHKFSYGVRFLGLNIEAHNFLYKAIKERGN